LQLERLNGLGNWLSINGEAIFDTRPWTIAEAQTDDGTPVRFTLKDDCLYVILLGTPAEQEIRISPLQFAPKTTVHLLGQTTLLTTSHSDGRTIIQFPTLPENSPAHVLKICPIPAIKR
jgi:alpha-L-fucosidase